MKGIPQGRYTKEFREEAVKMVLDEGISFFEAGGGRYTAGIRDQCPT